MKNSLISFKSSRILDVVLATAVGGQSFALAAMATNAPSAEPGARVIAADVNAVRGPLNTSFKVCVGAGRANEGLRADWQDQLRETRRRCGFQYIRMHGLLTDDMGVYKEDAHGNPIYNWQYIDRLYDFLLSIHIKPFVELSFMPNELASGTKTVFWWKGNITPPKSHDKWADLIRHLVGHFQDRYGHDEVKTWYFEVWNEPDLRDGFFTGTREDYFKLYAVTAKAVKSVSPDYRVGGPATAIGQFDEPFITYCHTNDVPLDFISTHAYGVKSGYFDETGQQGTVLDPDPNSVIGRMVDERKMIDRSPMPGLPLHFTEWSSAYTPSDFMHDTYQQASFILSKVKGAYESVNSMSYWVFTDIFEEAGPRMTPFHGGFGLMNYQDLKKPAFYAFQFLNELGPLELANTDPASWVCKSGDNSIQALFWDYTPIVPPEGMNDQQFYQHEVPAKDAGRVALRIANLPEGSYTLEVYRTGYRVNDVFTGYVDLGSPSQLTPGQVQILRQQCKGDPESVETIQIENGRPFVRSFTLRQNDVYFVKVLPLKHSP
ncbi:MAG TPA: glycoside hydrolase [Verrucomicrobiae bacterium]|nr:glycoside hydrolase [Verrucomicrobiae bacterium]